ncbi:MAG: PAS domain S-box protein, partial [Pseudomonadota bacterium]
MTHVLIVDDLEESRYLLKALLEGSGYRVTAARDGLEALAAARREPPDVIVSDALMPKMDGFALCRAWMQDAALRNIPFVFYSATYTHPDDERFALALGAVRYLIKPQEPEAFLAELKTVLREWAARPAPGPASPLDETAFQALHDAALSRKLEDKIAQLEAANQRLHEREERFRATSEELQTLIRCAPLAIFTRDKNRHITSWNPAAEQIYGWKASEVLGKRSLMVPEEGREESARVFAEVLAGAELANWEVQRLRRDGTRIFLNAAMAPLRDASGDISGVITVASDITERKRMEAARGQLAAIVENSGDAIVSRALDGTILSWNAGAEQMFGYSATEAIGKPATFNRPPGWQPKMAQNTERILRGETIARHELQRLTKDGRVIDVLSSISPVKDSAGQIIGVSLILHDVSERKRMEEALRATSEQLQTLICCAPLAIFTRDKNGLVTSWNSAAEQIYGWKESEILGKPMPPGRAREEMARAFAEVLAGAQLVERQIQRLRRDGTSQFLNVAMAPLRDASGNISGVITIGSDITERKRAEEALRESEERLRAIFEGALDGILVADAQKKKFVTANPAICNMLGYTHEEIVRIGVSDIHPKENLPHEIEQFERQLRGEIRMVASIPMMRKDGSVFYADVHSSPIRFGGEECLLGVFRDITERERMEAARAQLAAIVENSNDAIISRTLEGTIVSWNAGAEKMFGYSATEAIGKPITFNLLSRQQTYMVMVQNNERILRGETIPPHESQRVTKDGRVIDVLGSVSPVRDSAGKIIGASVILHDIPERKRAQQTQATLAAIVENASEAIIGRLVDGTIVSWNAAAERMFGYTVAEVVGGNALSMLVPPELQQEVLANRRLIATGQSTPERETVRIAKHGRRVPVAMIVSPIKDSNGLVVGAATIMRDITERKRAEEARDQLAAIVENSNDAIIGRTLDGTILSWNAGAERMF